MFTARWSYGSQLYAPPTDIKSWLNDSVHKHASTTNNYLLPGWLGLNTNTLIQNDGVGLGFHYFPKKTSSTNQNKL